MKPCDTCGRPISTFAASPTCPDCQAEIIAETAEPDPPQVECKECGEDFDAGELDSDGVCEFCAEEIAEEEEDDDGEEDGECEECGAECDTNILGGMCQECYDEYHSDDDDDEEDDE